MILRGVIVWATLLSPIAFGWGCAPKAVHPSDPGVVGALMQPPLAEASAFYRIQIGDELHVRFTFQPEMNEQLPVRPDGRITLATTGEIAVAGLTPDELQQLIVEKSSRRLRDPEVQVIVTKVGEQRVYVGGEVSRPGYVLLQPNMTPVQAVMQTGGFRMTAEPESVLLLSPRRDGEFSAARLNLKQVVEEGVTSQSTWPPPPVPPDPPAPPKMGPLSGQHRPSPPMSWQVNEPSATPSPLRSSFWGQVFDVPSRHSREQAEVFE
jgi:hypothetical protein